MAPIYAIINLAILEKSLYEIIRKNTIKIYKENLLNHGRDTQMVVSYSRIVHRETLMIFTTYSKSYTLK